MDDPIKRLVLTHIRYRDSFVEVPAAFTRAFKRNGKSYTFLGMEGAINEHLEKTVERIRNVNSGSD